MGIDRFATEFAGSAQVSVEAAYGVLAKWLADDVEVRHRPSAPDLDGWRSRDAMAAYLQLEAVAIPRAFTEDLSLVVVTDVAVNRVVVDPWTWLGTLRGDDERLVSIRYVVELHFKDDQIERIVGSPHPDSDRAEIRAWLLAIDEGGGFVPGPGSTAPRGH